MPKRPSCVTVWVSKLVALGAVGRRLRGLLAGQGEDALLWQPRIDPVPSFSRTSLWAWLDAHNIPFRSSLGDLNDEFGAQQSPWSTWQKDIFLRTDFPILPHLIAPPTVGLQKHQAYHFRPPVFGAMCVNTKTFVRTLISLWMQYLGNLDRQQMYRYPTPSLTAGQIRINRTLLSV